MSFCGKCGSQIEDGDTFCPICGEKIILPEPDVIETPAALIKKARVAQAEETQSAPKYGKDEDVFVDPDEKLISKMGNGWITNILALRKVRRICALLTDKRCYVQGNMYTTNGKDMVQMRTEKTVNVEDVNATGFEFTRSIKMLVFAIIFTILTIAGFVLAIWFVADSGDGLPFLIGQLWILPLALITLLFYIKYFVSKTAYFYIEYAGGFLKFDAKLIGYQEVQAFSKEIHRVKDRVRKELRQ